MANRKGFVTITNKEIYDSINSHSEKMDAVIDAIKLRLDRVEQRTSWTNKLVTGAYGFSLFVLGIIVNHLLNGG